MAENGLLFREDRLGYRLRHLGRRPRLVLAIGVFFVTLFLLPFPLRGEHRWLIAFDLAATVYLSAVWMMMRRSTVGGMSSVVPPYHIGSPVLAVTRHSRSNRRKSWPRN